MSSARRSVPLDRLDRRMLRILRDDARISVAALAERVHTSRANAYARMRRLEDSGVIKGFSARVDSRAAGLDVSTLVLVSCHQPDWRQLAEHLAALDEVEYCALISGEYDALLIVRAPDVETLRDVILERIQSIPGVRATHTMFVLDEVISRPFIVPPDEPSAAPPVVVRRGGRSDLTTGHRGAEA